METSTWSENLAKSSLRTSLQSEQSQRPGRSRDIYEASNRHPETGHPLQKKTGAARKIFETAAFKRIDVHVPAIRKVLRRVNVTLPATDQHPGVRPDDHEVSDTHFPQSKPINLQQITPPSGPIPNSKLLSPRPSTSSNTRTRPIDLYFLTPLEREVHDILHRMGRVAIYKGLLSLPHPSVTLLAHPTDIPPLTKIRSLTQKMEPEDRHKLATTLETLIDAKQRYVLNTLLFCDEGVNGRLRITDRSVGTGVESPEYVKSSVKTNWRRPTSFEIIRAGVTGVRGSWIQNFREKKHGAEVGREEIAFEKQPFTIFEEKESEEEVPRLRGLRGGGDDFGIPGSRSAKAYARLALGSSGQEKLGDEERVPRIMWWLAGGRVSCKKKAPTAGELRRRRKVEIENRKEVGFLGTMFEVRERKRAGEKMVGDDDDEVGEETSEESQANDEAGDEAGEAITEEAQAKGSGEAPAEETVEATAEAVKA